MTRKKSNMWSDISSVFSFWGPNIVKHLHNYMDTYTYSIQILGSSILVRCHTISRLKYLKLRRNEIMSNLIRSYLWLWRGSAKSEQHFQWNERKMGLKYLAHFDMRIHLYYSWPSKFYTKILKTKHRNHKQTNKWTKIKVTFVIIIHAKLVSNNHVRHNFYTCRLMRLFFVWPFFELKLL